jgi:hypothetical protein
MYFKNLILSLLLFLLSFTVFAQNTGTIEGRIFNSKNNEPISFATVAIFGTNIGSISDLDGKFLFTGLEPGYVEVRVTSVGFEPYVSDPVLVTNARKVFIDIPMEEANVELEEVTVKASPFRRSVESPVSLRRISLVEIEKNPGGNRDISKVIQSYPGVASTPAFRNDVIVRGGGASENRFYLDGIEIPNLNHFATQGASGGPVGIINVDFIREVDFYSGAFPASRGNALSSIIEFNQIDGNKEKLKFKGAVGASDLALTVDGPLGDKTTYIASVRRSYLQFLFGVIGLPFLPTYNDYQFKLKTRFNERNELSIISIGSLDQFELNEEANETEEQRYILGNIPVNEQWTYAIGAVYKHFRDNGFDTWVLSRNYLNNAAYKYFDNNPDTVRVFDYDSDEIENKFRYERFTRFDNGLRLTYGLGGEYAKYFNSTFRQNFRNGELFEDDYESDLKLFKWGFFGQVTKNFLEERLTLSLGIRADGNNYDDEMRNMFKQLSPRFSASYLLFQDFFLNFNTGRYFQVPSYTTLGFRDLNGNLVNQDNGLKYISVDHLVGGIEWLPDEASKLTLEGFYKYYRNYPYSVNDSVSISSKGADFGTFGDEEVLSIAEGRAYGMELLYRNRDLFGANLTISYTLVRSEAEDFRPENLRDGKWISTAWDNRHLLNILAIRELKNNWRVGMKWRLVGGIPFTPFDKIESSYVQAWDVRRIGILDFERFNQERLGAFHQLDLRVDKEFFLRKLSLNFYLDIQNVYNFQGDEQKVLILDENADPLILNPDDPIELQRYNLRELSISGGTVLPTIGIIIQF